MAGKIDIETAIVEILDMFKRADEVRAQLGKEVKELEQLALQKREVLDDIAKARKRKDGALAKRREVESEVERDIAYYKRDAKAYKDIAAKKRKEIFDEMQVEVNADKEKHRELKKENRDLEEKISNSKRKLQEIKEGII